MSCHDGRTPIVARMGEDVVLPAPAIEQALGFRQHGEQLDVEEFIPEPTVEGSAKPFCHGDPGLM